MSNFESVMNALSDKYQTVVDIAIEATVSEFKAREILTNLFECNKIERANMAQGKTAYKAMHFRLIKESKLKQILTQKWV